MSTPESRAEQINNVTRSFSKLIEEETKLTTKDYELLANLNDATSARYNGLMQQTRELLIDAEELEKRKKALDAHNNHIDVIYDMAVQLEAAVTQMEKNMTEIEEQMTK